MRTTTFLALTLATASLVRADVTTFEDMGLATNSYLNDAGASASFSDGGNQFNNDYDASSDSWYGWSISSSTDKTTPGYMNQYSAITGSGSGGSDTYAVAFTFGEPSYLQAIGQGNPADYVLSNPFHPSDSIITLAPGTTPLSIDLTNTTYAFLAFRDGDPYGFADAFAQGDYQLLDIRGYDADGNEVGKVDFYEADYRSTDSRDWYIVDSWVTVDLSSLAGSTTLRFGIQSSINDPIYGVFPPAYVAVDNFVVGPAAVPEPTSLALIGIALVGLAGVRLSRKRPRGKVGLATGLILAAALGSSRGQAGPYDPQVDRLGGTSLDAIPRGSSAFQEWASSVVSFNPGPQNIAVVGSPLANFGSPSNVLGPGSGDTTYAVVSLGDGGSITLGFDAPITDGAGADFAVFENGFLSGGAGMAFLELATVSVSSDGVHFFGFPSVSLTQTDTQVGGFSLLDASNLYNLAGKYKGGYGTPFDLSELVGISADLNVNAITQVRITDVVGSINPAYGTYDSQGHLINDPFPTGFATGGFDLGGVGVIHVAAVPEPSSLFLTLGGLAGIGLALKSRRAQTPRSEA